MSQSQSGSGITVTTAPNDQSDWLFNGVDDNNRYLGHGNVSYGFILEFPGGRQEFIFPINPSSIDQDEEEAVVITPTQGGGKFIENQGNIFKDIVINGTTGFLPRANFGNADGAGKSSSLASQLHNAAFQVGNATSGAAANAFAQVSGYLTFQTLRTLFRKYWQAHRVLDHETREKTLLYWLNFSDNEVWLVEPLSFRMARNAGSTRLTREYSIRLRTISKAAATVPPDPNSLTADATTFLGSLSAISTTLGLAVGLVNGSIAQLNLALQNQLTNITATISSVKQDLTDIASGAATLMSTPKGVIDAAVTNIVNFFTTANTLAVSLPLGVVQGLTQSWQNIDHVRCHPELFEQTWADKWTDANQNFATTFGIGGSVQADIDLAATRSGIAQARFNQGETIWKFCARVLGDASRAYEVIALNNLRYPYFAPNQNQVTQWTLGPNDDVFIPTAGTQDNNPNATNISKNRFAPSTYEDLVGSATSTTITKASADTWNASQWIGFTVSIVSGTGLGESALVTASTPTGLTFTPAFGTVPDTTSVFFLSFNTLNVTPTPGIQQQLGVDLMLSNTFDLQGTATGDLASISGLNNFQQAQTIKFKSTPGDLVLHPWFGLNAPYGRKVSKKAGFHLRLDAAKTLLSDSRVESIEFLTLQIVQNIYNLNARVKLKGLTNSTFVNRLL